MRLQITFVMNRLIIPQPKMALVNCISTTDESAERNESVEGGGELRRRGRRAATREESCDAGDGANENEA